MTKLPVFHRVKKTRFFLLWVAALLIPCGQGRAQTPIQQAPLQELGQGLPQDQGQAAFPPQKIANEVAVFAGLDKITGRIIRFDVKIDETVQFGALRVTPKVCYTRPATEAAQTTGFVEVDEVTLERKIRPLFSGWMFAASPGLHAVEHAIYDVWLADCKSSDRFSAQPVTPSHDGFGGRGFSDVDDKPQENAAAGPIPVANPLRN